MRGEIGDSHWLLVDVPREVGGRQGHLLISDQGMVDPVTHTPKWKNQKVQLILVHRLKKNPNTKNQNWQLYFWQYPNFIGRSCPGPDFSKKLSPLRCSSCVDFRPLGTWKHQAPAMLENISTHLSFPPMMLGPCRGTTTISRSPNLESVAKIGPSWLTLVLFSSCYFCRQNSPRNDSDPCWPG